MRFTEYTRFVKEVISEMSCMTFANKELYADVRRAERYRIAATIEDLTWGMVSSWFGRPYGYHNDEDPAIINVLHCVSVTLSV